MRFHAISGALLDLLLQIGRETHPLEFVGVLRGHQGIIDEFNLLPGSEGREDSATLHLEMMPLGFSPAGSVHSHPNGFLSPSDADLAFFPRVGGTFHVIVGAPYTGESWRCFTARGEEVTLGVVP